LKKILILGGTGILSSEISSLAIERGYEVTMVNRGKRKDYFNAQAKLIIGDLKNEKVDALRNKLEGESFDVVIDFVTYTVQQLKRSIEMVSGICKQYIFISSATAYLTPKSNSLVTEYSPITENTPIIENAPITENTPIIENAPIIEDFPIGNTGWQYAFDKAKCEWYLKENQEQIDFPYTIIRPYVTYGETRIPYQVIPMEYYTLINRILSGKPIPIFGDDVRCTLTNSKEFAVGAVGLFENQKAFGEAVHITADMATTWKEVLLILSQRLNCNAKIVNLPMKCLSKGSKRLGFDVDEILYDKARSMVFCNNKIKSLVPEFKGEVSFSSGIDASVQYFSENRNAQKINYAWDARIDKLMAQFAPKGQLKKNYFFHYKNKLSQREQMIYIINRYDLLYYTCKATNKLFDIVLRYLKRER